MKAAYALWYLKCGDERHVVDALLELQAQGAATCHTPAHICTHHQDSQQISVTSTDTQ